MNLKERNNHMNANIMFSGDSTFSEIDVYSHRIVQLFIEHMMSQKEQPIVEICVSGFNDTFIQEKYQIESLFTKLQQYQMDKCEVFYTRDISSYTVNEENQEGTLEELKEELTQVLKELEEVDDPVELFKIESTDTIHQVLEQIQSHIIEHMTKQQNLTEKNVCRENQQIILSFRTKMTPHTIMNLLEVTGCTIWFSIQGEDEKSLFYIREVHYQEERWCPNIYISEISQEFAQKLEQLAQEYNRMDGLRSACGLYCEIISE